MPVLDMWRWLVPLLCILILTLSPVERCTLVISTAALAAAVTAYVWNKWSRQKVTLADPDTKYTLNIDSVHHITHNVIRVRVALPSAEHVLGLAPGQCVYLSAKIDGRLVVRPYTPVSPIHQKGSADLIIKVYPASVDPPRDAGKMSSYLAGLHKGDTVRGPSGHCVYAGRGEFSIGRAAAAKKKQYREIGLLAGGSGITPILQVVDAVLADSSDPTALSLLYANHTSDDIIIRSELEDLHKQHPNRFKLWHTVSVRPSEEQWEYAVGRVDQGLLCSHLPAPSPHALILLCGPPGLVKAATASLQQIGHSPDNIVAF